MQTHTIRPVAALTPESFSALTEIADLPISELRNRVYSAVPEKMWQLRRWTRGQLIARLFDRWLELDGDAAAKERR